MTLCSPATRRSATGYKSSCSKKHKKHFPDAVVPLLYHPKDNRKQNIFVAISSTGYKEQLLLNDVKVTIETAEVAIKIDARIVGALAIHSQGLTI